MASRSIFKESEESLKRQQGVSKDLLIEQQVEHVTRLFAHIFATKSCSCSLHSSENQLNQAHHFTSNEAITPAIFSCIHSRFEHQNNMSKAGPSLFEDSNLFTDIVPKPIKNGLIEQVKPVFLSTEVVEHHYCESKNFGVIEVRVKKDSDEELLLFICSTGLQHLDDIHMERFAEVLQQSTSGIIVTNNQGVVVWTNKAFSKQSGYKLVKMKAKTIDSLLQSLDTHPDAVKMIRQTLTTQQSSNADFINNQQEGKSHLIPMLHSALIDNDGKSQTDMTSSSNGLGQIQDAELVRNKDCLLNTIIEVNNIGTWQLNLDTDELLINGQWAELLGYNLTELGSFCLQKWESLIHPDDLKLSREGIRKHSSGQVPLYEVNIRMQHKNGEWLWMNSRGRVSVLSHNGESARWLLGTNADINDQILVESNLQQRSTFMQAIVENMPDGVIGINHSGCILNFNRAAEHIFGYSHIEMIGSNIAQLIRKLGNQSDFSAEDAAHLIETGVQQTECEARHKNGALISVEVRLAQIQKLDKLNFILIVEDITHRKKRDHEIHQLAYYDPLTWLPNRRLLIDRLKEVIANCAQQNCYAALLFIDLDKFKSLNDSAGHGKGDLLLCRVAQSLSKSVRQGDIVSRLGGDEFVVVLENLSRDEHVAAHQAEISAEKIIAQLNTGFDLDGLAYNSSASIGITLFNSPNFSHDDLLTQADMAMYKAKSTGRNSFYFYSPSMQVEVTQHLEMEQDLHRALRDHQFQLYYQKQVDHNNHMTGVEVLLRWQHPCKGMISPAEFIPLAEETELIVPIGEWVLHEACKTLAQWSKEPSKAGLSISVNLSVVQFFNKIDIVKTVQKALMQYGAPPQLLKLEITESLLASNLPGVKAKMQQIKDFGVSFSIDDFGTGYSSLAYLKQLPLDQLKIDKSFVKDIIQSPNDEAIAQAVITLAESMSLEVIAEGVETEAQRVLLQNLGCKAYQGYLFGKPCLLRDLEY